jgi:hypothetical protein
MEEDFMKGMLEEYRWQIGRRLAQEPLRRPRILPRLWEMVRSTNPIGGGAAVFDLLGDLGTAEVQEFLWTRVFSPSAGGIHLTGTAPAALRGLMKIAPEEAVRAAEALLTSAAVDREELPPLLLIADPARAISFLCGASVREQAAAVRWAIGRALRLHPTVAAITQSIGAMMTDKDAAVRRAGAELCGWLSPEKLDAELTALATDEVEPRVRMAARDAQHRRRQEAAACELIVELPSTTGALRWGMLDALVGLADPFLLFNERDPLRFKAVSRSLSWAEQWRIAQRADKRVNEVKQRATETDNTLRAHWL